MARQREEEERRKDVSNRFQVGQFQLFCFVDYWFRKVFLLSLSTHQDMSKLCSTRYAFMIVLI